MRDSLQAFKNTLLKTSKSLHNNQPDSCDGVDKVNRTVRIFDHDPRVTRPVLLAAHTHVRVETEGQQQTAQQVAVVLVVALCKNFK